MKISELKQPYRRMAEYLGDENTTISHSLSNYFFRFYNKMHKGENPEITEEIKKHFPPDFDFSGEEVKKVEMTYFDDLPSEVKTKIVFNQEKSKKEKYTQLAKEGKLEQLPDTCEFSEAVELEVWDNELQKKRNRLILGKFKGAYLEEDLTAWNFVKLPTKKIDFSEFKTGDVVEVEEENLFYGQIYKIEGNYIVLTFGINKNAELIKSIEINKIKSITKIK